MANQVVKLKKGSDYLYPYADFTGVDITNIIASGSTNSWNVISVAQDCYLNITNHGVGVLIYENSSTLTNKIKIFSGIVPMKKGNCFSIADYGTIYYTIFGLKNTTE